MRIDSLPSASGKLLGRSAGESLGTETLTTYPIERRCALKFSPILFINRKQLALLALGAQLCREELAVGIIEAHWLPRTLPVQANDPSCRSLVNQSLFIFEDRELELRDQGQAKSGPLL